MGAVWKEVRDGVHFLVTPGGGTVEEEEGRPRGGALQGVRVGCGVLEHGPITRDAEELVGYFHWDEVGGEAPSQTEGVDLLTIAEGSVAAECEPSWVLWVGGAWEEGRGMGRGEGHGTRGRGMGGKVEG